MGPRVAPRHVAVHGPRRFKRFYADTALFGAASAIACSLDFFGPDHVLFASDSPFDPEKGPGYIRSTIANLDGLGLSEDELGKLYHGNAERLLGLPGATG